MLLYCTKSKPDLYKNITMLGENIFTFEPFIKNKDDILNGKIVGECDYEIEKIIPISIEEDDYDYGLPSGERLLAKSCLSSEDIFEYLNDYNGETIFKKGYAIHIKNLHIFNESKELSDYHISYYNKELEMMREKHLEKAPQNMCYVFDINATYVFISIHPEGLCKILNREKTTEVRRKVLKEMLRDE